MDSKTRRQVTNFSHELIAVIENDVNLRNALEHLLRAAGYRVELYSSAEEFMRNATTTKASCILLDIELGHMSGLQLVARLFAAGLRFPVVFMTGSEDQNIEGQVRELGYRLIRKPFVESELFEAIEENGVTLRAGGGFGVSEP